ncbi:hypothetical protein KS07_01315 [Bacillus subtilis]|nr:hypothetical protein KS07_01315 [Bacillus subtilis]AKF77881.1 hypothetical protein AAV30_17815 [Bacillus velezensis]ANB82527.1 hypothetical protein A6R78_00345 [Bacillus velezensis]KOC22732.1 hypothetical protein AC810_14240 [Bacillus velezensis]KOC23827.1 hypothetical protein AC811_14250 [Bacillus velezensis]
MHPPHILIGENQRVTGLLDWTEAKVADPAKDFVLYQVILGEKETKRRSSRFRRGKRSICKWRGTCSACPIRKVIDFRRMTAYDTF